jgi:dethiobiotin synthetase
MATDAEPDDEGGTTRRTMLQGFVVTSLTPGDQTALAAAMLICLLAAEGENVAAMVPVETGIEDPCEPGSRGSLVRWAAGHLDDPRVVTPFALEAARSTIHAADAEGTLLHAAAFERAREALCDGRSRFVVCDAVGVLDLITPKLTTLDLAERWGLSPVVVEPVSRWSVGHVRLLQFALLSRDMCVAGVILTGNELLPDVEHDFTDRIRETLAVALDCPVVVMPRVQSVHDRGDLLTAARECGLHRIVARLAR